MTILPLRDKNTNRLFWHSEIFSRVDYEIRENHLVIFGYSNGQMSISLDRLGEFIGELREVNGVYGGGR